MLGRDRKIHARNRRYWVYGELVQHAAHFPFSPSGYQEESPKRGKATDSCGQRSGDRACVLVIEKAAAPRPGALLA